MENELKAFYAAWLAKHNAPDEHPHRELFDMLVGAVVKVEYDVALMNNLFFNVTGALAERLKKLEEEV
jgi:hypothetical protein